MSKISTLCDEIDSLNGFIVGNFNACPKNNLGELLSQICLEHELKISDKIILPADSFTYVSAKLIKRDVPMCIVSLLLSWYRQQTMQVKWNTNYSSPFTVTNGVRQGGVLSPYSSAVYLDELSIQLESARVGCTVGNMVVNHLMFADDICVFSPSICGLQCLLNICGDYAAEHEITFNSN